VPLYQIARYLSSKKSGFSPNKGKAEVRPEIWLSFDVSRNAVRAGERLFHIVAYGITVYQYNNARKKRQGDNAFCATTLGRKRHPKR
jgi:hypothetical protein